MNTTENRRRRSDVETEPEAPRGRRIDAIVERLRDQTGQGLAEYSLILALIAVVAIVSLLFLGTQISVILSDIGTQI